MKGAASVDSKIREYCQADLPALQQMHAQSGFGYAFPDLGDPLFISKLVVEDADGRLQMASFARLTCEMYLVLEQGGDASADPRERLKSLSRLHHAGEADLLSKGLEDAHAWLPPPIARRFGRRLLEFGWVRDDAWTPYSRRLRD